MLVGFSSVPGDDVAGDGQVVLGVNSATVSARVLGNQRVIIRIDGCTVAATQEILLRINDSSSVVPADLCGDFFETRIEAKQETRMMAPMLIASALATVVAGHVESRSIYSARAVQAR